VVAIKSASALTSQAIPEPNGLVALERVHDIAFVRVLELGVSCDRSRPPTHLDGPKVALGIHRESAATPAVVMVVGLDTEGHARAAWREVEEGVTEPLGLGGEQDLMENHTFMMRYTALLSA
jgi:hypothetical protein